MSAAGQTNPGAAPARPRILQCITALALGGAERSTLNLLHELRDQFDYAVHTMQAGVPDAVGDAMREELAAARVPWYPGTRLPVKLGGMLAGGLSLARAIRDFQPDIVHLHTEIPEAGYATAITVRPSLRRHRLVRTIHNSLFWHHWTPIGRWAERRMPPAHIIGVSQDATAAYHAFSRRAGSHPLSTEVIYNGSKLPGALPPTRPSETPVRLLFAGRFELQKGADLLPEILARIPPDAAPGGELTIMGSGEFAPLLARLAARPPAGWRISLTEPQANLASRLGDFDLILMPSRFEGLGMVAIEALLRKIPLVATSAPGLREAFPPDYPWLAAPGDAGDFTRVLLDAIRARPRWAGVMAPVQAHAIARFSLDRSAARYREFYRRILAAT